MAARVKRIVLQNWRSFFLVFASGLLFFACYFTAFLFWNDLTASLELSEWAESVGSAAKYLPGLMILGLMVSDIRKRSVVRTSAFILSALTVVVVSVFSFLYLNHLVPFLYNKTFDETEWRSTESTIENGYARLKMVDDLLAKNLIVGKTQTQVLDMLGAPTSNGAKSFPEFDAIYWLGPERSLFSLDSESLGIKFENGVATQAELLRD